MCELCEVPSESFIQVREAAAVGQETAALRMKRRATHLLKEFMPGDNATIRVPEFDRGPTDPKNLIVVILEKFEDTLSICRICTLGKMALPIL